LIHKPPGTGQVQIDWRQYAFGSGHTRRKTIGFGTHHKKEKCYDFELYIRELSIIDAGLGCAVWDGAIILSRYDLRIDLVALLWLIVVFDRSWVWENRNRLSNVRVHGMSLLIVDLRQLVSFVAAQSLVLASVFLVFSRPHLQRRRLYRIVFLRFVFLSPCHNVC
jgi:hypothetical protein